MRTGHVVLDLTFFQEFDQMRPRHVMDVCSLLGSEFVIIVNNRNRSAQREVAESVH